MLVLGFTNHYYTQWNVITSKVAYWAIKDHYYQKNLSMDYDAAVAKITANSNGNFEIDLSLRGDSYFQTKRMIADFDMDQFTFGMKTGDRFSECTVDDAWQLNRAMNSEPNPRRRVNARKKLIELGEVIKYRWTEHYNVEVKPTREQLKEIWEFNNMTDQQLDYLINKEHKTIVEKRTRVNNYCPKKLHAAILAANEVNQYKGHWFKDGERVEISIKPIGKAKTFDGQFGTTFLQNYITPDKKVVKYMGTTPPYFEDKDQYMRIKATVKHEMYRDQKETKLSRIKTI